MSTPVGKQSLMTQRLEFRLKVDNTAYIHAQYYV